MSLRFPVVRAAFRAKSSVLGALGAIGTVAITVAMPTLTLGTAGCLTPRPAINRVQPDYVDKRDFIPNQYAALTTGDTPETVNPTMLAKEPVFYTQTTLIKKPTTTGFTGLTSYSENDKIRWEVSEHFLIGRQSYEFIKGNIGGANGIGKQVQTGDPVAVFAIRSHFDVKNEYNSTTGEELNIVDENTSDRPWYQRRYMRVEWSQNLVTGYNMVLAEASFDNKLNSEPGAVFVNTPNDPNAPVFEFQGDGDTRKLKYFDIVHRAILHPETTSLSYSDHPGSTSGYSAIPVCFLNQYESSMDCAPAEVTFRMAFRRTDPTRDYEPAPVSTPIPNSTLTAQNNYQHLDMERFGFFDQARVGYDPVQHTTLDTERMHFASRHNLWIHHHVPNYGSDTSKGCNFDADCDSGLVCHIKNEAAGASNRGFCATIAPAHDQSDIDCTSDDDCLQTVTGAGQSRSAFCDTAVNKCAERYIRCGADDECKKYDPNSTCDLAIGYTRIDNRGMCLLPFLQRQVRPIAYHESIGYPDYMQPVTEQIVTEWNDAFQTAVIAGRRHECEINKNVDPTTVALESNPCNAPAVVGLDPALGADAKFVYVGCHSPVWGTAAGAGQHTQAEVDDTRSKGWDLPACGPQGTSARLGDLRYSMIGAITDQDQQGYWGLANIASDPETGEMIIGRGAVWQTITDNYASWLVTLVQLLSGNITTDSITNGDYLVESMKQFGTGNTPSSQVLDEPLRQPGALESVSQMRTGIEQLALPDSGWFTAASGKTLFSKKLGVRGAMDIAQQRLLDGRVLGDGTGKGTQRLLSLKGTALEGMLVNRQQALLASGASPDPSATLPATLDEASPLRQQSIAVRRVVASLRKRLQAWECQYEAGFSDDMLLGFAQRLASGVPIKKDDPLEKAVAFGRDWDFGGAGGGTPNWALMKLYAAQFIHHGVLAHELGHSLGQRHNFTASADAINYFDQYWKVRGQGHPDKAGDGGIRPRYQYIADGEGFYSQEEIAGRVDEWAYSSVMDYKGLNEDAHGLGRYDYAFIKNGYLGIVEAWKKHTLDNNSAALWYALNAGGTGLSTTLDLRDWAAANGQGQAHGMHYTQIPKIYGTTADGVPDLGTSARYDVFLRETCGLGGNPSCNFIPGWGPPAFSNATVDGHLLVSYRFDTDERAGLVWQDQRYDAGGDAFESLHYVQSHLLDYYFANSYARLRSGFSTKGYVNRMWSRYIEQLHQCTQLLAFDLVNFQDFLGANTKAWNAYKNDPAQFGGFVNQLTMGTSADTFAALLTMPEMGQQGLTQQFDKQPLVGTIQSGSVVADIAVNDGRVVESNWRNDVGFFWVDMLNVAGSYYDKVMAVQSFTDPDLFLLQRDTPSDIRLFELSYYSMFPDQMIRFFGGIIAEDYQDYAPIIVPGGTDPKAYKLQRTHIPTLNLPAGTGAGKSGRVINGGHIPIDPQTGFTVQLWTIIHGMAQFPATYDQRYADNSRLWVDGSIEAIQVDPAKTISFPDPFTGYTWRALTFPAASSPAAAGVGPSALKHFATGATSDETGIAARALLHVQDLDAARLAAIAKGDPVAINTATLQEQKYIDVLQALRSVTAQFGHGYANEP